MTDNPTDLPEAVLEPIPMVLYCPRCGLQHIDEPDERTPDWRNPPHRSHLCHKCGCIWRPADVPTNGVAVITTRGKADNWPASTAELGRAALASQDAPLPDGTPVARKPGCTIETGKPCRADECDGCLATSAMGKTAKLESPQ